VAQGRLWNIELADRIESIVTHTVVGGTMQSVRAVFGNDVRCIGLVESDIGAMLDDTHLGGCFTSTDGCMFSVITSRKIFVTPSRRKVLKTGKPL
jgi:hypothetical protein